MVRSGLSMMILAVLLSCGGEDNVTRKVESRITEKVLSGIEDRNRFTASIAHSPLGLDTFKGRLSVVDFSKRADSHRIEIQSGDATLNMSGGATNYLQGIRITVHNWRGELQDLAVYNPEDAPSDGRAYAVVAYSEVKRGPNADDDQNWYTYRTRGGTLTFEAVEPSKKGGVRGSLSFDVLLLDTKGPRPGSVSELPLVQVEAEFNVQAEDSYQSPFF